MEVKNKQAESVPHQAIEIRDPCERSSRHVGKKICGGASCGFSDVESSTKDAKERQISTRKLMLAVLLFIIVISIEVYGGIQANSLAILTDAAHLLSDVAAIAISIFSLWASRWEATPRQSYGFFRIEILGALVSIQLIWLLTGILVYQAFNRLSHNSGEVEGNLMFGVAAFGFVVNIAMALMLGHEHGHGAHGHVHGGLNHGHGHGHAVHGHDHHHDITITTSHHLPGHSKQTDEDIHEPLLKHHEDADHGAHGHVHGGLNHGHGHADVHGHGHAVHGHNQYHDITITTSHRLAGHSRHIDEDIHGPLSKNHVDADHVELENSMKQRNINVQGAYLHVLGDLVQSIGVMIGGAIIWYKPEWKIIDLICTIIFSLIVLATTIKMLRNILEVLMESTPREIDATRLEKGLCDMDGVVAVHELHIWAITVGKVLLACHVTITPEADAELVLDKVIGYIKREYNISHVTIQIERT